MGTVTYVNRVPGTADELVSSLSREDGEQLQRFLTRMLGRRELAEEVAQEAYLKLYRLCRPDEVNCPKALLFDVATKLAITRLKRVRVEASLAATLTETDEVRDQALPPERRAMVDQAMHRLTEAVEALSPNLRKVFVMRYVQQMPRHEIAERLSISVNAVEQRLTRALAQCRHRLAALGIDCLGGD